MIISIAVGLVVLAAVTAGVYGVGGVVLSRLDGPSPSDEDWITRMLLGLFVTVGVIAVLGIAYLIGAALRGVL